MIEKILKLPSYQHLEALLLGVIFYLIKILVNSSAPSKNNLVDFFEFIFTIIIAFGVLFKTILELEFPPLITLTIAFWVFWKALFNGAEKVHFFNKKTTYKAYNGKIILKNGKTINSKILIEK